MSTNIPLKIRDAEGNLQQLSTSEENYLAYQMGLQLAERSDSDVSALTLNSSGAITVGSFTDTFYNEPVGTHPGSSITTGSTTTTLYQVDGSAATSGSEWRIPVGFEDSDRSFREMIPTDFDSLTERLLTAFTTNDYPGVYRLDSAGFSDAQWDVHLPTVFSDTQTDGTTVNYNIYQRQSITPPSSVKYMGIKRSSGATGLFEGLQEATDAQMKYTLGQKAKTVIMSSGIGTYQLRSSAQGAPTDPGTWVAKGVAIDTRKQLSDSNFATQYTGEFSGNFSSFYSRQYTAQYTDDYAGQFTRQYAGQYTDQYVGVYGGLVTKSYTGSYIGARNFAGFNNFAGTVSAQYTGTVSQQFTGFYIRQYVGQYTATYKRNTSFTGFYFNNSQGENFIGSYTGTSGFNRQWSGFYGRNVAKQYTGTVPVQYTGTTTVFYGGFRFYTGTRSFSGTFSGQFTRNYVGSFARQYTGLFAKQYTGNYASQYARQYTQQYVSLYTGIYTVTYAGEYAGQTIQSTPTTIETYTLYVRTA